jgi:hypothetical protein
VGSIPTASTPPRPAPEPVSLARHDELITSAEANIDRAEQAEAENARLIVERLHRIMLHGSRTEKPIATLLLSIAYDHTFKMDGPLRAWRERSDQFAQQRMSDALFKAYWDMVFDASPTSPRFPSSWDTRVRPPKELNTFDAEFARAMAAMQKDSSETRGMNRLDYGFGIGETLHLDWRHEAAALERIYQLRLKLPPPVEWKQRWQLELAARFQWLLDLDRSTAYLLQLQDDTRDPKILRSIIEMLSKNRELARVLQDGKHKEELREFLRCRMSGAPANPIMESRDLFVTDILSDKVFEELEECRDYELPHRSRTEGRPRIDPVLLGSEPTWVISNDGLSTGPRSDYLHASEIRHMATSPRREEKGDEAKLVVGAAPVDRFSARFAVSFELPREWRFGRKKAFAEYVLLAPKERRQAVGILFGLRNILHRLHPLEGYEVRLTRSAVQLVKVTAASNADVNAFEVLSSRGELRDQLIAEWPADLGTPKQLEVSVALDGESLTIEVNGKSWRTKAPGDASGFLGFHFTGTGYAEIGSLQVVRP